MNNSTDNNNRNRGLSDILREIFFGNSYQKETVFEDEVDNARKRLRHKKIVLIWTLVYYFAIIFAYIAVSLAVPNSWAWSWVIPVIGIILSVMYFSIDRLSQNADKKNNVYLQRMINTIMLGLVAITLLVFAIFVREALTWRYLLLGAIFLCLVNTVLAYVLQTPQRFRTLLTNIFLIFVLWCHRRQY